VLIEPLTRGTEIGIGHGAEILSQVPGGAS